MIVVGARSLEIEVAKQRVVTYATSDDYLFGAYDAFRTNDDPKVLADGDLLAPVLLNVQVKVRAYRKLQGWRPQLQRAMAGLPDIDLHDASDDDIDSVAACFDVLDREPRMGVTLAKVLHRKHPRLVPLYDRNVYACYVPGRVSPAADRTWSDFVRLLLVEMRIDLAEQLDVWNEICSDTNEARQAPPDVTPLRALDILAWWPEG